MIKWIVISSALLSLSVPAFPQPSEPKAKSPSVTVSGEAVIWVEPDQAEIDIGLVTQAQSALQAAKENAAKLSQIVAEVKKLLGAGDEAKTASYSLNPNYRYPREGGKPEITGYTATNILRIKTSNLAGVGKLIDAAMGSGANTIQRLLFTLRDEEIAQRRALRAATAKARAKADEVARALGLKIARVLSVSENERTVRPLMRQPLAARSEAMVAPTPVEVGPVEVRSSVSLTAELAGAGDKR